MSYRIHPWRWRLKKLARRGATLLSRALTAPARRKTAPCLRVLTYHRFDGEPSDPVSVGTGEFEAQLHWLSGNVDVVDGAAFARIVDGSHALTRDAVLLTVDDGHRSFLEKAFPLLQRYRLPAILFVCPGLIEREPGEFMTWEQLAQVQAAGVQIASHGFSHRSLARCGPDEASRDIRRARTQLKIRLGVENPFFALPFGTRRDFSDVLADALLAHGYRYCFTSVHGPCRPLSRPNLFPRIKIEGGEPFSMFQDIVRGGLDVWRMVDELAWPIQQRGRL